MRRRDVRKGMAVDTTGTSGAWYECRVLYEDECCGGLWWLASPAHGYAIARWYTEFQKSN